MKLFTSEQIRQADEYTIKNEPIASVDLMERAAKACTHFILDKYSTKYCFKIFAGPGNNGGDGLAIARLITDQGFSVTLYIVKITDNYSPDFSINLERLNKQNKVQIVFLEDIKGFPTLKKQDIIIDAMFGSGLTRELKGLSKNVVEEINKSGNQIIAIDIPSGLFSEENTHNPSQAIVKANTTLTFQFPKLSFFFPENSQYVGNCFVLDIGLHSEFIEKTYSPYHLIELNDTEILVKKRLKFSHKGDFGHALSIAGSYGKIGAAILMSKACLKTGTGLVTTHIPKCGYQIIQSTLPEIMVSTDASDLIFTETPDLSNFTAVGIGPGLNTKTNSQRALKSFIEKVNVPVVFDADALNILSINKELIELLPENAILTPHPGEFKRLIGDYNNNFEKIQLQITFAQKYKVILVVKGAHTSIATPNGSCFFNTTGNVGMATAGSGDVLTGIILSLLAQKYAPQEAAILGVYLHGLAGDLALVNQSEESLTASDIINNIGKAYKTLRNEA